MKTFCVSQKGLTLEQVDQMFAETTPRTSAKWRPHTTYASAMGAVGRDGKLSEKVVEEVIHDGRAV